MFLEIFVFVGAVLLGVLIYWRESRSNSVFRAYNAFINKKETRMAATDRKGFFYQRSLVYRILNALLVAIIIGIVTYYIPILNKNLLEIVLASFVGILAGSYLAAALPTVKRAVDNPLETLQDVGEAGKDIISDLSNSATEKMKEQKKEKVAPAAPEKEEIPEEPKKETARERMKRKGYLK